MEAVAVLLALSVLAVAARRWGVDSTDDLTSPEWERRRQWRGFTHPRSWPDGRNRSMVTPSILMLAEVEHAERLRRAECAHLVAEALAGAPARRRWPFPFRFRRIAPRPAGPKSDPCARPGAHPSGLTQP